MGTDVPYQDGLDSEDEPMLGNMTTGVPPRDIASNNPGCIRKDGEAQHRLAKLLLCGLVPTPEIWAVFIVYLVQGMLQMTTLASTYFLKDHLKMDPPQADLVISLGGVPWIAKPLYGICSDCLPICGYHRVSYLFIFSLLGSACWASLALWPGSVASTALLLAGANLGTAVGDVVIDSVVVGLARGQPDSAMAASLQSLCWGAYAVGGIVSAYFGGLLVQHGGPRLGFTVAAAFPLAVTASAFLVREERRTGPAMAGSDRQQLQQAGRALVEQARMLFATLRQPAIWRPMVFVVVWLASPSVATPLFYFLTNSLGLTAEFMGRVQLVGQAANLLGIWLYQRFLKRVRLRRLLPALIVGSTIVSATQLMLVTGLNRRMGMSDGLFALADTALIRTMSNIALMPQLVFAARVCPEGVEATMFASLMSLQNAGRGASELLGAALTRAFGVTATSFARLPALVATCAVLGLWALPLLPMLPASLDSEDPGQADDDVSAQSGSARDVEVELEMGVLDGGAQCALDDSGHRRSIPHTPK